MADCVAVLGSIWDAWIELLGSGCGVMSRELLRTRESPNLEVGFFVRAQHAM